MSVLTFADRRPGRMKRNLGLGTLWAGNLQVVYNKHLIAFAYGVYRNLRLNSSLLTATGYIIEFIFYSDLIYSVVGGGGSRVHMILDFGNKDKGKCSSRRQM